MDHDREYCRYYTSSKQLADDVQEIALKIGLSAKVSHLDRTDQDGWTKGVEYRVNISKSTVMQVNQQPDDPNDWVEDYVGTVYCCEVPGDGIIMVRRNGKPIWCGNSKVHDTHNIIFACKTWNLRSTDIMQGVVFGHLPGTRFDYDECFGTVINRFCVQAVAGMPLTVYGKGGQTRGYLPLKDSIECLTLSLENPPKQGEYRVFNQFAETYSVNMLATTVKNVGRLYDIDVQILHIDNPRKEAEEHFYQPIHEGLARLGYCPSWDIGEEIANLIETIIPYKDQIRVEVMLPKIQWAKGANHDFCI